MRSVQVMRLAAFRLLSLGITRGIAALFRLRCTLTHLKYKLALWLIFEPRDDDVFIVTYPKAGTTVLQMMLYQMSTNGEMDINHINSVVPWFDQLLQKDPFYVNRLPSPRLFKTHLPFKHLPRKGRFVYGVRNPKDSCLSYYYHHVNLGGSRVSLQVFVKRFASGNVWWGSWFKHFRSCFPRRRAAHVCLVMYEELCADREAIVDRLAAFCGFRIDEAHRSRIIERCAMAYMKQHEDKFDPRLSTYWMDRPNRGFIRNGLVGECASRMTPDDIELLERLLHREITRLRQPVSVAELSALRLMPVAQVDSSLFLNVDM